MRLLFLSLVFFATSALAQTNKANDINSSGTNAQNTSVDQTNSWGTNVGSQTNTTTNVTGGYGNLTNPGTVTAKVSL